jgi:hypothetical protein
MTELANREIFLKLFFIIFFNGDSLRLAIFFMNTTLMDIFYLSKPHTSYMNETFI